MRDKTVTADGTDQQATHSEQSLPIQVHFAESDLKVLHSAPIGLLFDSSHSHTVPLLFSTAWRWTMVPYTMTEQLTFRSPRLKRVVLNGKCPSILFSFQLNHLNRQRFTYWGTLSLHKQVSTYRKRQWRRDRRRFLTFPSRIILSWSHKPTSLTLRPALLHYPVFSMVMRHLFSIMFLLLFCKIISL